MNETVVRRLSGLLQARMNCAGDPAKHDWMIQQGDRAIALVKSLAPSGSGFDSGTLLDLSESTPERIVFHTSFHHMDEHGSYDGWTEHTVTVRPTLASPGFRLSIGGRNRNDIKDVIHEAFDAFLGTVVDSLGRLPDPVEPPRLSGVRLVPHPAATLGVRYLPLPLSLQSPIDGGCSCTYCTDGPSAKSLLARWDTLAIPPADAVDQTVFTVHMPEAHGVKRKRDF